MVFKLCTKLSPDRKGQKGKQLKFAPWLDKFLPKGNYPLKTSYFESIN